MNLGVREQVHRNFRVLVIERNVSHHQSDPLKCVSISNLACILWFQMFEPFCNYRWRHPLVPEDGQGLPRGVFHYVLEMLARPLEVQNFSQIYYPMNSSRDPDMSPSFPCLDKVRVIDDSEQLSDVVKEIVRQLELHLFLSLHTRGGQKGVNGEPPICPKVITLQALPFAPVIIHIDRMITKILKAHDESYAIRNISRRLRPIMEVMFSDKIVILGAGVADDVELLKRFFLDKVNSEVSWPRMYDSQDLFDTALRTGMFGKQLTEFVGGRRGLNVVSLAVNGFQNKPMTWERVGTYMRSTNKQSIDREFNRLDPMLRQGHEVGDGQDIERMRRGGKAPIEWWDGAIAKDDGTRRLHPKQVLTCCIDVVTPFKLLLQLTRKFGGMGKLSGSYRKGRTLSAVLDEVLWVAYHGLERAGRAPPYFPFRHEQLEEEAFVRR